ncbi:TetR family transcriptional regulator [Mycobacteroides chelonae]|uniref:TetR family transcriptional regulator n=2 Tax=Mycobacteriaceae TaxID=1762 RepID=A0A1S1LN72_MYCCH|nr:MULTISPECIES: TetR/AcrR family transcriptional regulator [Mycobacteroides]KRQ19277.1 TetR family transcriptional regulator [Mycobacteroides sp. H003]KRQ34518.1 TetR family transcriptional regulator [Mycobacteroides sp. H092]KRQ41501.1 TetR family transcriptional regulator [Mycobacteroides sp. H101]KRQ43455.1 TetR family transcriptional regulator [Mycobacteroides sp. H063]KRQ58087.1 TetR family transcriptional regulator [Mycobacteroides sp. HXVII]
MATRQETPTRLVDRQRAKRSEMVKEEVIEAALIEFAERGYHQTSIAHIAERLGSGHSMFYRYFTNKRDILEHVVRHTGDRVAAALSTAMPESLDNLEEFEEFAVKLGTAFIAIITEDPRISRLMLMQSIAIDREMTEQFIGGFKFGVAALSAFIRGGIDKGYIRAEIDVPSVAESIVAIPFGLMLRHGHKPDREVLEAHVRATADFVCRGIAAP